MLINNVQVINNKQQSSQIRIKDSKIIEVNSFEDTNFEEHNELTLNFSNVMQAGTKVSNVSINRTRF